MARVANSGTLAPWEIGFRAAERRAREWALVGDEGEQVVPGEHPGRLAVLRDEQRVHAAERLPRSLDRLPDADHRQRLADEPAERVGELGVSAEDQLEQ